MTLSWKMEKDKEKKNNSNGHFFSPFLLQTRLTAGSSLGISSLPLWISLPQALRMMMKTPLFQLL